ncbi:Major sperm protein [Caenorhabditis elegans]|uniref:Major sperm protein n=1 Tax=Caenorhabditis elegans TaxID=6239 RepID=Q1XFY6_CAEEL|nr:Major sperm protein [Caenorhabditis elegans]CCD73378.2 Major sperm protein [Caenorhabditis elegans]|eukprot:NP_491051.4 Major sperm protein [Caenorhabditis elegans]
MFDYLIVIGILVSSVLLCGKKKKQKTDAPSAAEKSVDASPKSKSLMVVAAEPVDQEFRFAENQTETTQKDSEEMGEVEEKKNKKKEENKKAVEKVETVEPKEEKIEKKLEKMDSKKEKKEEKVEPKKEEQKEEKKEEKVGNVESESRKIPDTNTGKSHVSAYPPGQLLFTPDECQEKLTITNTHDKKIMYKLKLSDNIAFQLNPVFGVLEPGKSVDVAVTHRKSEPMEGKLIIVNSLLTGDEDKVKELFKQITKPTGDSVHVKLIVK